MHSNKYKIHFTTLYCPKSELAHLQQMHVYMTYQNAIFLSSPVIDIFKLYTHLPTLFTGFFLCCELKLHFTTVNMRFCRNRVKLHAMSFCGVSLTYIAKSIMGNLRVVYIFSDCEKKMNISQTKFCVMKLMMMHRRLNYWTIHPYRNFVLLAYFNWSCLPVFRLLRSDISVNSR